MNRLVAIGLLVTTASAAVAQDDPRPSKASEAFMEYECQNTTPAYGLAKVQKLIGKTPEHHDPEMVDDYTVATTDKQFRALTTAEKFTYCMIHGEVFTQTCDAMPAPPNIEKKVFARPIGGPSNDLDWSDRQTKFLHSHRSAVIKLLGETIRASSHIGGNLKSTIVEIDAYELIPDLVQNFQKGRKDTDILSTLFVLMKDGKFQPFLKSQTYRKLYGSDDSNRQSFIVFNDANKDLSIQRAMAYYKSRMH